jgi:hypothetical protein
MKMDSRAPDDATLTELRRRGIAAVQAGECPTGVAPALGVYLRTLFRCPASYRQVDRETWRRTSAVDGHRNSMAVPCGGSTRPSWTGRPSRLNSPFALWTGAMVQTLMRPSEPGGFSGHWPGRADLALRRQGGMITLAISYRLCSPSGSGQAPVCDRAPWQDAKHARPPN